MSCPHGGHYRNHRRLRPRTVRKCTCGRELSEDENYECGVCRRSWERAKRSPRFLPTVELFPELVPDPEGAGLYLEDAPQCDLFTEE